MLEEEKLKGEKQSQPKAERKVIRDPVSGSSEILDVEEEMALGKMHSEEAIVAETLPQLGNALDKLNHNFIKAI